MPSFRWPFSWLSSLSHVQHSGNQQRVLLARELSPHPPVLVACSPTRGLDVRAVATIHRLLLEQRQRGGAILLISEDLDELVALADRIAVISTGEIAGWVQAQEVDASRFGLMMSGGGARATSSIRAESRA